MRILSSADVAKALTMREAIAAMRHAFPLLSSGAAVVAPRVATPTAEGVTLSMPAYLPAHAGRPAALTVKVVSVMPRNSARGLPVVQGAVLVLDDRSGAPVGLIDGRSLTALRTGAATGLATDLLARSDARTLVIFGRGGQSQQQIQGVQAVRPIASPTVLHRGDDPSLALRTADIVVTATNSTTPVFRFDQLAAGVHVNAIGSFRPDMRELDPATMAAGKVFVDSRESAQAEAGELQDGVRIHGELGELVLGLCTGRTAAGELTIFKSVGNAAQDAAIAQMLLASAEANGLGREVDFR